MIYYSFQDTYEEMVPIGKIICLIRSYRKHAEEMGSDPTDSPLFFLKPASAVIFSGDSIVIPPQSHCLHHEIEVGVVVGKRGKNIPRTSALDHILGYVIGLDITARDIQDEAKKHGLPWSIAKGFDTFAPLSEVVLKERISTPNDLDFSLEINGVLRQKGNTRFLLWSIERIISDISDCMTLEPGDLILTGTPEGVGKLQKGDSLRAELSHLVELSVDVA
ncbi:MAG: fumarylacetoacetate hydrolase family protein [Candidatus Thermoplasmatota archaeon]|nr:fumarylacetoacetate hydrolase family protein [Candidatus Thermoplasmatota archaeon]